MHNYELHRTHNYEIREINVKETVGLYRGERNKTKFVSLRREKFGESKIKIFPAVTCRSADDVREHIQRCE